MKADPTWPVIALAVVTFLDGLACVPPIDFIREAQDRVDAPDWMRRVIPWVKFAAAAGLIVGLWVPAIGLLTTAGLIAYFVIATIMHVRARDSVTNTAGAVAMLVFVALAGWSFL
jgi:hypothetical protein